MTKRSYRSTVPRPRTNDGKVIASTWPFADGYPWDDELIRARRRALSTHGPYRPSSAGSSSAAAIRSATAEGQ